MITDLGTSPAPVGESSEDSFSVTCRVRSTRGTRFFRNFLLLVRATIAEATVDACLLKSITPGIEHLIAAELLALSLALALALVYLLAIVALV